MTQDNWPIVLKQVAATLEMGARVVHINAHEMRELLAWIEQQRRRDFEAGRDGASDDASQAHMTFDEYINSRDR